MGSYVYVGPVPPLHRNRATVVTLVGCLALTGVLGLLSDGAHHDDDLVHFLVARWAHRFPEYLLHHWGRPGLTLPLAAVAWIGDGGTGWHACRLLSAGVTAAAALLAARVAQAFGLRLTWLVVLACYFMPLNTLLAGTTLTENFTALYLIGAVALLLAKRPVGASCVFSLALVTRHETLVLVPIWWLAIVVSDRRPWRRACAAAAALWAPALHNILFRLVFGQWLLRMFSQPQGSSEYLAGGPLAYIPHALMAVPPAIAGLAVVGGVAFCRRGRFLVPALASVFLATHIAIRALGLFASGGFARFMVAVAPFVAILAVAGWEDMADRLRRRRPAGGAWLMMGAVWLVGWLAVEVELAAGRLQGVRGPWLWVLRAGLGVIVLSIAALCLRDRRPPAVRLRRVTAGLLMLSCAVQWAVIVRPLRLGEEEKTVQAVVRWLSERGLDRRPIFAANPWVSYFMDLIERPRAHKGPELLASMPVGTLFIWDSRYSGSDFHGLPDAAAFGADRHYVLMERFRGGGRQGLEVYVFQKVAPTPMPLEKQRPYPENLMAMRDPWLGIYYVRAGEDAAPINAATRGAAVETGPDRRH